MHWLESKNRHLKHVVRAVAKRRFVSVLTAANIEGPARVRFKAYGFNASIFVFAIAKRLALREPARTPGVHAPFFKFDLIWTDLGWNWICHSVLSDEVV